jgi:hypothetical protein
MRHTPKLALSAVALGSALAAACGCARAEQEPNYESIDSISVHAPDGIYIAPVIEVASDGNVYTQPTGTSAHLSLVGEAKTSAKKWRLADLHYGIGAMVANTGQLTGTNYSFGSFYSAAGYAGDKTHFKQELAVQVPLGESGLGVFAAARCNAMRKGLEADGVGRIAIFNQDRDINIPVAFHFAARAAWKKEIVEYSPDGYGNLKYWRQATMWRDVKVRCQKTPDLPLQTKPDPTPLPQGPQDFKLKVGVSQATLTMLPSVYSGVCPAKLNASAVVVTNGPTEVKYRLEKSDGTLSPIASVKVDQTNTAFFNLKVNVGEDVAGAAPGNVVVAQMPQQAGPAFAAQSPGAGVYKGFFRLRIVSPNTIESSPANYDVTCKPKLTGSTTLKLDKPSPPAQPIAAAAPAARAIKASPLRCMPGTPCRAR